MRLLIMSDGTPHGTRVTDEYHKPIEGVVAISWKQTLGEAPVIQLTLNTAQVGLMVNDPVMAEEPEPWPASSPIDVTQSAEVAKPTPGFESAAQPATQVGTVARPAETKPKQVRRKRS